MDKAKNGDRVTIHYTGKFDDGTEFDSTARHDGKPLEFIVGAHHVIPGFEQGVLGLQPGEEKNIHIEPEQAYGERDPDMVKHVPRAEFPMKDVEAGMVLGAQMADGHVVPVQVKAVTADTVTLDLNHPLAGKALNFHLTLVEILEENCSLDAPAGCGCGCSCDSNDDDDCGSGCCDDNGHHHHH